MDMDITKQEFLDALDEALGFSPQEWLQTGDRKPDEFESQWFQSHDVPLPIRVLDPLFLDKDVREDNQLPYPFPQSYCTQYAGCYFWYMSPGFLAQEPDIVSLYVGRSSVLPIRLCQHWREKQRWHETSYTYGDKGYMSWVALWYEPDHLKMCLLEHLLIGQLKPQCNRA